MPRWDTQGFGEHRARSYRGSDRIYGAYGAAMPFTVSDRLNAPERSVGRYGYDKSVFGRTVTIPEVSPLTVQKALELGFNPNQANASVMRRGAALLADAAIYVTVVIALAVAALLRGSSGAGEIVLALSFIMGPAGFYFYRAVGDAVFEGSPGKHAMGLSLKGAHGMPISARDGFVRNAWILPSMIPFAGWLVSAGMMAWIAGSSWRDPLGRGGHERSIRTRVVQKPE